MKIKLDDGRIIVDVKWFTNKTTGNGCVGIITTISDIDNQVDQYIGYGMGKSESDDMISIAKWGSRLPKSL